MNDTSFNINICDKPPILNVNSIAEKNEFCSKALVFISCMDASLSMVCDELKGANTSTTIKQFQNLIKIVNKTYHMQNCDCMNKLFNKILYFNLLILFLQSLIPLKI